VLLIWMVVELRARYELRQAQQEIAAVADQMQRELDAQARQARAVRLLQQEQAQKAAQRRVEQQQLQAQRLHEFNEANRRKEAAWREFYKPASECQNDVSVACGNAYIRARQEFERRYAAGEL